MRIAVISIIVLFLTSPYTHAVEPFNIVVGLSKPPYVIKDNISGFEIELIKQLMTTIGKTPRFNFIPLGRSEKMLAMPNIDAVMTANTNIFPNINTLSDNYIEYHNVAISLKKNKFVINNIADLGNHTIASFQLAHKLLGNEFANAVTKSPMFIQVANQEKQVELLLLERIDVLVMDIKIFFHFLDKQRLFNQRNLIEIHEVFPVSPYRMAFKDPDDVLKFNAALKTFKQTESYKDLVSKYNF